MSEQRIAFDRVTARRFVRAVKDFLTSEVRWQARGLFALLIAFALTVNGLNVINSYVGRDFMTAIAHRDQAGFIRQAVLYVGVFAGSTAVVVLYRFTEERLGLFWRVWLTRRIIRQYFADRTYLHLKESATVDKPRPADRRRRSRVHGHHPVVHADVHERGARGPVVLGSALDDQPAPVRCRRRVRRHWHAGDDLSGPAADRAELPPVGPGGQLPLGPDPRPRERRVHCASCDAKAG